MIQPIVTARIRSLIDQCLTHNADIHGELRAIEQGIQMSGNTGYMPVHFRLEELVSHKIFARYGDIAWQFLDDRLMWTADAIWEHFKPAPKSIPYSIIVNDWLWGGPHDSRGFRAPDDQDGAYCSQHRMGRALDIIVQNHSPIEVCKEILANQGHQDFQHITTIKLYVWGVHIDCRNTRKNGIVELSPAV